MVIEDKKGNEKNKEWEKNVIKKAMRKRRE